MERCAELIEKLQLDYNNGATAEQLLATLQILQKELVSKTTAPSYKKSNKVTVLMPNLFQTNYAEAETETPIAQPEPMVVHLADEEPEPLMETPVAQVPEYAVTSLPKIELTEEPQPITTEPVEKIESQEPQKLILIDETEEEELDYVIKQTVETPVAPVTTTDETPITTEEKKDTPQKFVLVDESDDDEDEYTTIPTVAQQDIVRFDVAEQVKDNAPDLNEKLTSTKKEHLETLVETPLKDLKKGIGLNDKFVFVQELFRNDEVMYERSIKTINSFNIYPEAQYWIERELKIKLGWDDAQETVQHFYGLVRRRFASM